MMNVTTCTCCGVRGLVWSEQVVVDTRKSVGEMEYKENPTYATDLKFWRDDTLTSAHLIFLNKFPRWHSDKA